MKARLLPSGDGRGRDVVAAFEGDPLGIAAAGGDAVDLRAAAAVGGEVDHWPSADQRGSVSMPAELASA
jgi:hypothetical protein